MANEERQEWLDAIQRLTDARNQRVVNQADEERVKALKEQAIVADSHLLDEFLHSDNGKIGLSLLRLTQQAIVLGTDDTDGSQYTEGFLLMSAPEGEGLFKEIISGGGMAAFYSRREPQITYSPISAIEAVRAAVTFGGHEPGEVTSMIRARLTQIAQGTKKE